MNKFHQNMNKCNINFYKGKHKLEGAQTVEYKKEDVLDTWKSLSLSKRREYFFFIDKVLVNKINDVNKHLRKSAIESQITKETVWKIASNFTMKHNSIENTPLICEDDSVYILIDCFEILWKFGEYVKLYKNTGANRGALDLDLLEYGITHNAPHQIIIFKNEFLDPPSKLISTLEGVVPHFLLGSKVILNIEEQFSLFFSLKDVKTWRNFESALGVLLENRLLLAHKHYLQSLFDIGYADRLLSCIMSLQGKEEEKPKKKKWKRKKKVVGGGKSEQNVITKVDEKMNEGTISITKTIDNEDTQEENSHIIITHVYIYMLLSVYRQKLQRIFRKYQQRKKYKEERLNIQEITKLLDDTKLVEFDENSKSNKMTDQTILSPKTPTIQFPNLLLGDAINKQQTKRNKRKKPKPSQFRFSPKVIPGSRFSDQKYTEVKKTTIYLSPETKSKVEMMNIELNKKIPRRRKCQQIRGKLSPKKVHKYPNTSKSPKYSESPENIYTPKYAYKKNTIKSPLDQRKKYFAEDFSNYSIENLIFEVKGREIDGCRHSKTRENSESEEYSYISGEFNMNMGYELEHNQNLIPRDTNPLIKEKTRGSSGMLGEYIDSEEEMNYILELAYKETGEDLGMEISEYINYLHPHGYNNYPEYEYNYPYFPVVTTYFQHSVDPSSITPIYIGNEGQGTYFNQGSQRNVDMKIINANSSHIIEAYQSIPNNYPPPFSTADTYYTNHHIYYQPEDYQEFLDDQKDQGQMGFW